jgi:GH25 family lysozyme M1 (1,4-beta-N-acetylmuramidase)
MAIAQDWVRNFLIELERVESFYLKNLFNLREEFNNIKKQVRAKMNDFMTKIEKDYG